MARKNPKAMRGMGDIPKEFRKSKSKSKDTENVKDAGPRVPDSGYIDLEIREDDKGLFVRANGMRIPMSPIVRAELIPGEVWTCLIDTTHGMVGPSFIAAKKVSDAPEPVEEASEEISDEGIFDEPEDAMGSETVISEESPGLAVSLEVAALREAVSELRNANATLRGKAAKVDAYEKMVEEKEETIANQKRKIDSLTIQVKVLNSRDDSGTIMNLQSEIGNLNDIIESKDLEIERLRAKLKSMGIDDLDVVPRMPKVPKAVLTGAGTIHFTTLDDGRYTVFVNPRVRKIRIIPDESGRISCWNGSMDIGCISSFSGYESARSLPIDECDGYVEIQL